MGGVLLWGLSRPMPCSMCVSGRLVVAEEEQAEFPNRIMGTRRGAWPGPWDTLGQAVGPALPAPVPPDTALRLIVKRPQSIQHWSRS